MEGHQKRREIKQNETIMKRFGSWNNALEKAGLPLLRKHWTKKEILKTIDEMILEHGRPLTLKELNEKTELFSPSTFSKNFGVTYQAYLEDLGFYKRQTRVCDPKYLKMSDEEILQELKKELKRINTNDYRTFNTKRKKGFPSDYYFKSRFKVKWIELLEMIDIDANVTRLSKKEFVKWYLQTIEDKGYIPTNSKLDEEFVFFRYHMRKYFGSYTNMCKELGIQQPAKTPDTVTETDEELLEMYKKFSEKLGRPATKKELDESDEIYSSDVFAVRFGGMNELKKLCGYDEYVTKSLKKYSKEEIKKKLIRYYKENNGKLTNKELNQYIPISTVLRYFKTTKMSEVWEEIEREIEKENKK